MRLKTHVWFISLFLIVLSCKQNPAALQRIEGKQIPVNSKIVGDSSIATLIVPYRAQLKDKMNRVLAYSPTDLHKERNQLETNIGNFMADLCYEQGNKVFHKKTNKNIDFVLLNFGGIRAGIPKGEVTTRNAYELMPFENSMVVVELSYEKVQDLLTYLVKSGTAHPISKQLRISIKNKKIVSALLNGKEFDKSSTYNVLTSDYLQHGGDRMNFFKNPIHIENLDYKIRTAIIDELEQIDTINAIEDGRVKHHSKPGKKRK